ncbi:MAG: FAD-dependent thymidylate synthase [Candidatus Aenigmarchaeota archaeon]|nr:FAD-dependent thymidylate synthase [Candidatus Aenigmarchaeota archaeon]
MDSNSPFEKPKVKLIAYTRGSEEFPYLMPDDVSTYAANADFNELSSWELISKDHEEGKLGKKNKVIIRESYGRGHGSVGDVAHFTFSIKGLTRAATLQLTGPTFLEHEQQSFRRTKVKNFYIPEEIRESPLYGKITKLLEEVSELYYEMLEKNIPMEDARFCAPLLTKTNITTTGNARELQHLHAMNEQGEVPSYVKDVVEDIILEARKVAPFLFEKYESNYETLAWYPSTQIFSSENKTIEKLVKKYGEPKDPVLVAYSSIDMDEEEIDDAILNRNEAELANLKHIHFDFLVRNSIVTNHQIRRQRTMDLSDESIYTAAERGNIIIPPKIRNSNFEEDFEHKNRELLDLYEELVEEGVPRSESIGVIPHSLEMYTLIHVNGFNSYHFIGKRTCVEAQWEIRGIARKIANKIKELNPKIGKYSEPQCITYGKCPEREECGYLEAYRKKHGDIRSRKS